MSWQGGATDRSSPRDREKRPETAGAPGQAARSLYARGAVELEWPGLGELFLRR